jgi:hypothetical protein
MLEDGMQLGHYVALLHRAERDLAGALRTVAEAHRDESDVFYTCARLAQQCQGHEAQLQPFQQRYAAQAPPAPDALYADRFGGPRTGGIGLLRDLHDLYVMTAECDLCWTLVAQGAQGARDEELLDVVKRCESQIVTQQSWLRTRLKQAAPQALVVAS